MFSQFQEIKLKLKWNKFKNKLIISIRKVEMDHNNLWTKSNKDIKVTWLTQFRDIKEELKNKFRRMKLKLKVWKMKRK